MGNDEKELVVPREPSHEMALAGFYEAQKPEVSSKPLYDLCVAIYRAMIAAAPASTIERSAIEQWSPCADGVPAAITLMVARFDHELGDWIVGVTESYMIGKEPKAIPAWTHWRYLPTLPEAPNGQ